jgi:hypothetical protein
LVPEGRIYCGDLAIVFQGEGATGEDVCGGEGGGGTDAVEEEDLVCWGYEEDAGGGSVS